MNLTPRWAGFLVDHGFEAVHWSSVGTGDEPDIELMNWAARHGHVVLTTDLGFAAILAATQRRQPSVIQIRGSSLSPESIGAPILAAVRQAEVELESGALLTIDVVRRSLRILPLAVDR
jgi:predicted nuclease of predicted toxin-antitoxin system